MKIKAILLFSGGLDSILAAHILIKEGIEIIPVTFFSPFSDIGAATKLSKELFRRNSIIIDISEEMLKIVQNPLYGYGSQLNPCIDCRILIFKKAGEIAEQVGAQFIATGEVLGERPMTQNKNALLLTAKRSGYEGLILRPLSAKLLPPTIPEKEGWINREHMLDIQGRSRKRQMELARIFGIENYPSPAGGCRLTDPAFAERLRKFMKVSEKLTIDEVELLKFGRHFVLGNRGWLVLGRNQRENDMLIEAARCINTSVIQTRGYPGPTGLLLKGRNSRYITLLATHITLSYSDAPTDERAIVSLHTNGSKELHIKAQKKDRFRKYLVNK